MNITFLLNWLSIYQRCVFNRCILMYKIVNNCAPFYLINYFKNDINLCYSLRSGKSKNVVFKLPSTEFYKHSFAYSGIQLWNNLPESVKLTSTISVNYIFLIMYLCLELRFLALIIYIHVPL